MSFSAEKKKETFNYIFPNHYSEREHQSIGNGKNLSQHKDHCASMKRKALLFMKTVTKQTMWFDAI